MRLQQRGYALLQWMERAMVEGFIAPDAAEHYGSGVAAAYAWLERHWDNLPPAARPERHELLAFSKLFTTYLASTFDLEKAPGERLYSPDAHCFCFHCSWFVKTPHLRPKRLRPADRKRAARMRRDFAEALAREAGVELSPEALAQVCDEPASREALAMCAYAVDLSKRLEGIAVGPASLALWRGFAWTAKGSPKKGFVFTTEGALEAEAALRARIVARGHASAR